MNFQKYHLEKTQIPQYTSTLLHGVIPRVAHIPH